MIKRLLLAATIGLFSAQAAQAQQAQQGQVLCRGGNQVATDGTVILDSAGRPVRCPIDTPLADSTAVYVVAGGVIIGLTTVLALSLSGKNGSNPYLFPRPTSP